MQMAVLGMGRMGRAIAERILGAGHELSIWNRTPGRAADLVAAGARECDSPSEAVTGSDTVVTMLSADDAVRSVVRGDKGVLTSLADGAVLVDCSTVSPDLGAELERDVPSFASVPILGNPDTVRAGMALLLLGASDSAAERARPLVEALGGNVRRYSHPALATSAKLTCNLLLLSGLVALAEAFAVGTAGGLSPDDLRQLLAESPLVAPALRNRFEAVLTGRIGDWWTTELGHKDVRLALQVAEAGGRSLPSAGAVLSVYQSMIDAGYAERDIAAVHGLYLSDLGDVSNR